jgi:glutamyl-tRNA synthetase
MPAEELVELLIPYWQEAGYSVNLETERSWLESLTALIAPSLTRLSDAAKESRLIFGELIKFQDDAIYQLKQPGVTEIIKTVLEAIYHQSQISETEAKEIVNQVTKSNKVKKGVVMKSLRAGLMGELQGPDLIQSWVLLNQKGWDKSRLQQALTQAESEI